MFTTADQCFKYVLERIEKANAATINRARFNLLYNSAQLSLVRSVYESVDKAQKYVDMLRILTPAPLVLANSGLNQPEQDRFDLPYVQAPLAGQSHGYLHMLSVGLEVATLVNGQVTVQTCSHSSGFAPARIMSRDSRYVHDNDPFRRPSPSKPFVYYLGNQFTTRCGVGNFASRARIEYLRYPVDIDAQVNSPVDPELPSAFNQSVCDLVVSRYLEQVESPRTQTSKLDHPLHT